MLRSIGGQSGEFRKVVQFTCRDKGEYQWLNTSATSGLHVDLLSYKASAAADATAVEGCGQHSTELV